MSKPLRRSMPKTAEAVDLMREMFGKAAVDQAIATAERAREEYLRIEREDGRDAAEVWRRANWRLCTFYAPAEGEGRSLGIRSPFNRGVVPCVDPAVLRAAEQKLADERRRQAWRQRNGQD